MKGSDGVKTVEELMAEADALFEDAELLVETDLPESLPFFRDGIGNLCRAYLLVNGEEPDGGLKELFLQCKKHNPDFSYIEDEIGYFLALDGEALEPDAICDAANEIWDFVAGLVDGETE